MSVRGTLFTGTVITWLAALLQSTVLPFLRWRGGHLDLIMLIVVSWALIATPEEALKLAFVGGLIADLSSGIPIGGTSLALIVSAFAAGMLQSQLYRSHIIIPLLASALGTGIYHITLLIVMRLNGRGLPIGEALRHITIPSLAMNMTLMMPVFLIMDLIYERIRSPHVTL